MLLNWISAVVGVVTALLILYLVRRDHLHARYALWWIPAAFVIAFLGIFPRLVDWVAPILGITYGPVLVLVAAVILITIKILLMDVERSRNEVKLHRLIQRVAMLEEELKSMDRVASQNSSLPSER
jgi:hypothetical protein